MATMANEGEVGGPITEETKGTNEFSPVMSYERGTDHIEPVTSGGEIKYRVGGSQGTHPQKTDAVEGKAPEDETSTLHNPAPVNGSQESQPQKPNAIDGEDPKDETATGEKAGNEPELIENYEDIEDGGVQLDDEDPYRYNVKEGKKPVRGPTSDENSQPKSILKKTVGTLDCQVNTRVVYDCGCMDIYDHTGKKRQQACEVHRFNPLRSVLPLPSKTRKVTNSSEGTQSTLVAKRNDQSPPPPPPVVIPTKGRVFVKASKNGPEFIDPFNSDPVIEPTGPPNTLTTIPTRTEKSAYTTIMMVNYRIPNSRVVVNIPEGEAREFDERFNARKRGVAPNNATQSVYEDQDAETKTPLHLHTEAGVVAFKTNSNGEPSFFAGPLVLKTKSNGDRVFRAPSPSRTAIEAPGDGEYDDSRHERRTCATCSLM